MDDIKRKLWYRCQRVLPLVYDDSLSYYELLAKMKEAINAIYDDIDDNLETYIEEHLPELIADASYDAETDTLKFVIGEEGQEQILNDPISRISINGASRPIVDQVSRTAAQNAQTTATAAQTTAGTAQTAAQTAQTTANAAQTAAETAQTAAQTAQTAATYASTIVNRLKQTNWLYQKDVCFYGDSTTVTANNYVSQIHATSMCRSVTVRGVSGQNLTNQAWPIINEATDLGDFDYVFICYGINDWSGISRYNWVNAVERTAKKIIADGSEPVFVFPWFVYMPSHSTSGFITNVGCDMEGYIDGAIDMCEKLNVKYFNFSKIANVNKDNYRQWLTPSQNGDYLHENADLSSYISKAILTGNYNTGKNKADRFTRPFRNLLPTNWRYANYSVTMGLIAAVPVRFRKGKPITITSSIICEFHTVTCGDQCRVTGYAVHAASGGYINFYYIDNYDASAGAQFICRVNSGCDFDFTFESSIQGGNFKLAAQASEGGYGLLMDLAITGNDGDARLTTTTPTTPALSVAFENNITVTQGGYIECDNDTVKLMPFSAQVASAMTAGTTVKIGTLPFYPQHVFFGTCHIGNTVQTYRINQVGEIYLYVLSSNLAVNTWLFFEGCDLTGPGFTT